MIDAIIVAKRDLIYHEYYLPISTSALGCIVLVLIYHIISIRQMWKYVYDIFMDVLWIVDDVFNSLEFQPSSLSVLSLYKMKMFEHISLASDYIVC